MDIKFPLVIVGSQWGDEGKGKVVDILSDQATDVVRYNGGNNAGHSVVLNGKKFKLSLLPSGVIRRKRLYLSQGVVIDPKVLLEEINFFEKRKIKVNLMIDPRVNIVMPYHKALDAATEIWKGKKATGSLHLGIGYCYEDKNNRFGVRFEDLISLKALKERLELIYPLKKLQIEEVYGQKFDLTIEKIHKEYVSYGKKLKKYLGDVSLIISKALRHSGDPPAGGDSRIKSDSGPDFAEASTGRRAHSLPARSLARVTKLPSKVLFEGAHGTFLDGIFGTWPYTTAVYTIAGGVFPYVGIPPQKIYSMGIVKAYTTRVGNGPFPTELFNKTGNRIRSVGGEFGTVSKRPRRCGWLDLPLVRTAIRLSGFDYLAITKLDVLSGLEKIKICTSYTIDSSSKSSPPRDGNSKILKEVPSLMNEFGRCKPVYKEFKGWRQDISNIRKFEKLPKEAKTYINFIKKELKTQIKFIFVGPDRNQTINI